MAAAQRVLNAAESEHDDQREREENNERADEPRREEDRLRRRSQWRTRPLGESEKR